MQNFRLAQMDDAWPLRHFIEWTFRDTYTEQNTPDDMERHVALHFGIEKIRQDLQQSASAFLVVEQEDQLVGFAKIILDRAQAEVPGPACEIEKFYIHPDQKGQGLGRALMIFCENWILSAGFQEVWLGVWENNQPAINFYQRMGFQAVGTHVFVLGNDAQTDLVLHKTLGAKDKAVGPMP
jgi:diamine N-acetyltransferase